MTKRREWDCPDCLTELVWVDDMTGYRCPECCRYICIARRALPTPKPEPEPEKGSNNDMYHNAEMLSYIARLTKALNDLGPQPDDVHLIIELRDGDYTPENEKPTVIGEWHDEHGGTAWMYVSGEPTT